MASEEESAVKEPLDLIRLSLDERISFDLLAENSEENYIWVKMKNQVSSFGMGDRFHPLSETIYAKLNDLMKIIKEAGYVPDTSFALHDTDEEQKEHNLWNHSEKIALAFGLINSVEGSTIRVFKNLRGCCDCHSVYKFVSKSVGRDIVLRDPYRFHHFSRGECSCSDYW